MTTYTNKDVADSFQLYADYVQRKIEELERVDSLPMFGYKNELRGRKIAIPILREVQKAFSMAAQQHGYEAFREKDHYEGVEQLSSWSSGAEG